MQKQPANLCCNFIYPRRESLQTGKCILDILHLLESKIKNLHHALQVLHVLLVLIFSFSASILAQRNLFADAVLELPQLFNLVLKCRQQWRWVKERIIRLGIEQN